MLDAKRVVVTGGAGGIGNAAVRVFTEEGARVACTFNSEEPDVPAGVLVRRCDVADRSQVDTVFDAFAAELGGIDAVVHAAGVHGFCPAEGITDEVWDRTFALNATSTLLGS